MRLNPAETLIPDDAPDSPGRGQLPGHLTRLESWRWSPERAAELLCAQFRVHSLTGFGCAEMPAAVGAAGAALAYLERTNPTLLALLTGLRLEMPGRWVGLDAATRRNLELTRSFGTGGSRGSLLGVLDLTRTAMGARALRRLIGQPLCDLTEIDRRQRIIGALVRRPGERASLGATLAAIGDLERLLGRIASRGAGAREFITLARALQALPDVMDVLVALQARSARDARSLPGCPGAVGRRGGGGRLRSGLGARRVRARPRHRDHGRARDAAVARRAGEPRAGTDRHSVAQGRVQQGLRVLHRGDPSQPRPGSHGLRAQADRSQRRALRHRTIEGGRGARPGRGRRDRTAGAAGAGTARAR